MKISKRSIDDLNVVVKVIIEKPDYEVTVNETLKDYRKKANMPGFRKGMVPAGLIKKMYGKSALAEEVNKILSRELTKYIVDQKLNVLGEPLPSETEPAKVDFEKEDDFEFSFDLGLSPEINIDFSKVGKLPFYELIVDADLIDKQVEGYANRFGENVPAEVVVDKESIIGDFVQLDPQGNLLEDGLTAVDVQVSVQLLKDEAIQKLFIGAKVGDVLKFNPKVAMADDHQVAHLLKVKEEQIAGLDAEFNFTIKTINTFVPAVIDESLIQKVYGDNTEVKTIEEFRNKIEQELKFNNLYSSNYKFLIDAKAALTGNVAMTLPEAFLKRWLVETNEKVTAEQIEGEFESFRKDLEWTLIKSHLAKENDVKIDEQDVVALAREMALMQFRQYGMFNVPDEYLDNYATSILQDKEQRQRLTEKKIEDKVLELIKEKAGIEQKPVSQKEFDDLFEK